MNNQRPHRQHSTLLYQAIGRLDMPRKPFNFIVSQNAFYVSPRQDLQRAIVKIGAIEMYAESQHLA